MDSGDLPHPNWKVLATAHLKWKVFVQAKPETQSESKEEKRIDKSYISGEDAKKFYEGLLHEDAVASTSRNPGSSHTDFSEVECSSEDEEVNAEAKKCCPKSLHKAMKHAQNNEEENLRQMLDNGLSVNAKDEFGWSLLMVAACGGAKAVVRTLLERKARTGTRDSKGNTAIYLAMLRGHQGIVDMLIKANKRKDEDSGSNKDIVSSSSNIIEKFYCDICKITVETSTRLQHETSIVHQFNVGAGSNKTVYGIPASNKGFQILVNQGWDTEKGLGPDNSGAKFPVKTALKNDRKGIGAAVNKTSLRVTHFGPGDASAVQRCHTSNERIERQRTISRRERNRLRMKEKRREIEIRRALSEPDY
ncbi:G patch domain and ankyrin repeat-containing protein 1 homolog isoform X1 [Penaeus chinensis]|uniref:G patch domain and ankyrin repeat-containing protein 1 homolog isoform X1 n=1 Tax=Penaeus chinensis TaxID=139456 RepID=UPI001FB6606D|nr:G patch domain and ankyrin repeat-containing protein 1 homolog isoform X1 [Penaeus chinensis]